MDTAIRRTPQKMHSDVQPRRGEVQPRRADYYHISTRPFMTSCVRVGATPFPFGRRLVACSLQVSGEYLLDIAQLVCNTPMCGAVCAGQITEGAERISQRNRCTNVPSHARVIR